MLTQGHDIEGRGNDAIIINNYSISMCVLDMRG